LIPRKSPEEVDLIKIIPNLLSIFRICLVPVFIYAYLTDPDDVKVNAIIIYGIAAFSDFLDGYIARKFDATSSLGMILDPLGDKLMIVSVLVCMTIDGIIPYWAVIIAFLKELLMAIGGYVVHRAVKVSIPPAKLIGKISTVYFFIVCMVLMIFRGIPHEVATGLITVAIILMLAAFAQYILDYDKLMKSRHQAETQEDQE